MGAVWSGPCWRVGRTFFQDKIHNHQRMVAGEKLHTREWLKVELGFFHGSDSETRGRRWRRASPTQTSPQ